MSFSGCWKRIRKTGSELLFPKIPVCAVCGRDIREGVLCAACRPGVEQAKILRAERLASLPLYSCYRYEGGVRSMLLGFKMRGKPWLAGELARQMAEFLLSRGERFSLVTFVPLSKKRELLRGYNQAELLAREIGARMGAPVLPLLTRVRKTKVQSRLSAEQRVKNLEGAFGMLPGTAELSGSRVLLVDDIATTGTTLTECAKPLCAAGASVVAAVFARA